MTAVSNCSSLFAIKDGRVSKARVLAIDDHEDVAVIGTDLKPYLPATFVHTQDLGKGGQTGVRGKLRGASGPIRAQNHFQRPDRFRSPTAWVLPGIRNGPLGQRT
jgi:hypothetical protein